ncbi:MAG TPA: PIN domain-containing protein [Pyrinomonadaceae bacterium]|nr:PIN domain-containing protein [Acidobacteriota bacterium]HQZ95354.1 PIN domain-containing protein [Pyrinomonadaceae bacterium]
MKPVFVDTSGWASLLDRNEGFHKKADAVYSAIRQSGAKLVTSNYIIAELTAVLMSPLRLPKPRIITYVHGIKSSDSVEIVHVDESLDHRSWTLLTEREDKNWSLIDCSRFVIMQDRDISDALTADHNFEQAGFVQLLKY